MIYLLSLIVLIFSGNVFSGDSQSILSETRIPNQLLSECRNSLENVFFELHIVPYDRTWIEAGTKPGGRVKSGFVASRNKILFHQAYDAAILNYSNIQEKEELLAEAVRNFLFEYKLTEGKTIFGLVAFSDRENDKDFIFIFRGRIQRIVKLNSWALRVLMIDMGIGSDPPLQVTEDDLVLAHEAKYDLR